MLKPDPYLKSRLYLELIFTNEGPLHIGGERLEGEPLLPLFQITMNNRFVPVIPKTSLKGVLKRQAELITKSLDRKDLVEVLNSHENDHEGEKGEEYAKKCPICNLFGSIYFRSRIRLSDAIPISTFSIFTKPGIKIDRKTRTVEKRHVFFILSLNPGAQFKMKLIYDNPLHLYERDQELYKLPLRILIQLLKIWKDYGIFIGGQKSRGYGLTKLDAERSRGQLFNYEEMKKKGKKEEIVRSLINPSQYLESLSNLLKKLESIV